MARFGSYLATAALLLGGLGLAACGDDSDTAPLSPSAVNVASPAADSAGLSPGSGSRGGPGSVAALPGVRSVAPEDTHLTGQGDKPSAYQFSVIHFAGELHVRLINDDWGSINTDEDAGGHAGSAPNRVREIKVYHCRTEPRSVWTEGSEPCGSSLGRTTSASFPVPSRDLPFTLPPIRLPACTGWIVVWLDELSGDRANGWRNEPCPEVSSPPPPSPGAGAGGSGAGASGGAAPPGSVPLALQLGEGPSIFTIPAGGATASGFNLHTVHPGDYLDLEIDKLPAGRSIGDGHNPTQGSNGLWAYYLGDQRRRYQAGEWARGGLTVGGNVPEGIACGDYHVPYKVIRHPTGNPLDGTGDQRPGSFVVRVVSTSEADNCSGTAPGASSGDLPIALQRAADDFLSGNVRFELGLRGDDQETPISGLALRTVNPDDFLLIEDMSLFPEGRSRDDGEDGTHGLYGYHGGVTYEEGNWARGGLTVGGTLSADFGTTDMVCMGATAMAPATYEIPFTVIRHPTGNPTDGSGNQRHGIITVTLAGCGTP